MSRKETLRNTREIAQAPRILARHGRRTRRDNHGAWIMGLITVTLVFFLLDIAMGPVKIPLKDILKIILGEGVDSVAWTNIVEQIRLPKACTAVLVGCALSVGGLLMQTLFRNPLAGPEVLGLTSGASLGVSLVMLASGSVATIQAVKQIDFLGGWILVLAASTGSAITLLIVLSISLRVRDNVSLLIIGMMIGTLTISLVSLMLYFSSPEQIQDYLMWTFGSIGGVTGKHLFSLFVVVSVGLLISLLTSKPLNMLLLGENYARTMGLSVRTFQDSDHRRHQPFGGRRNGILRSHRLCRARRAAFGQGAFEYFRSSSLDDCFLPARVDHHFGLRYSFPITRQPNRFAPECRDGPDRRAGRDLGDLQETKRERALLRVGIQFMHTLKTNGLRIGYKTKHGPKTVAENIEITLEPGQLICLLGPNGSGKSTLIRTLAGISPALSGSVELCGHDLTGLSPLDIAKRMSLVLTDRREMGNLKVRDLVALGRAPHTGWLGRLSPEDEEKVDWAIEVTGNAKFADRKLGELSDGECQKAMTARALAQDTPIIMLDEATAHLDLPNRVEIIRLLRGLTRKTGKSVILSTHELDLALQAADGIWLMRSQGEMKCGAPEDLVLDGTFEAAFKRDGFDFDRTTGHFKFNKTGFESVELTGDGHLAFWTRRALERNGFRVGNGPESSWRIEIIEESRGRSRWISHHTGESRQHPSIADLIRSMLSPGHIRSAEMHESAIIGKQG